MTPEEVLEELKRVCATLDKTVLDNMVKDRMILQQHEKQQKQEELHAREKQAYEHEIAEKDAVIKSNEEKIKTLESELRDMPSPRRAGSRMVQGFFQSSDPGTHRL